MPASVLNCRGSEGFKISGCFLVLSYEGNAARGRRKMTPFYLLSKITINSEHIGGMEGGGPG